jgi:hypothetical protein
MSKTAELWNSVKPGLRFQRDKVITRLTYANKSLLAASSNKSLLAAS